VDQDPLVCVQHKLNGAMDSVSQMLYLTYAAQVLFAVSLYYHLDHDLLKLVWKLKLKLRLCFLVQVSHVVVEVYALAKQHGVVEVRLLVSPS